LVLLNLLTIACARSATVLDTRGPDILWLPQGSVIERDSARPVAVRDGRSIYVDGTSAVVFSIDAQRRHVSDQLVRHFAREGWRQRKTQFMNPSQATSFDGGWEHRCGCVLVRDSAGRSAPGDPYYEWRGEWENDSGDLVSYVLGGPGDHLRGYASYLSREVVRGVRRRLCVERGCGERRLR
jgi:hypothetical protein